MKQGNNKKMAHFIFRCATGPSGTLLEFLACFFSARARLRSLWFPLVIACNFRYKEKMSKKNNKGKTVLRAKAKGEWEMEVDPQNIRFMHSKISPVFSDGREVTQTLKEIESGSLKPQDLP